MALTEISGFRIIIELFNFVGILPKKYWKSQLVQQYTTFF